MLRTLSSEALVTRCLRALGYTSAVPSGTDYAQRVADCVNDALRRVWTHAHWPMLRRTERRMYRPPYTFGSSSARGKSAGRGGLLAGGGRFARARPWRGEPGVAQAGAERGDTLYRAESAVGGHGDRPWRRGSGGVRLRQGPQGFPRAAAIVGCSFAGDYPGGGTTRINLPPDAPDEVWVACSYPRIRASA